MRRAGLVPLASASTGWSERAALAAGRGAMFAPGHYGANPMIMLGIGHTGLRVWQLLAPVLSRGVSANPGRSLSFLAFRLRMAAGGTSFFFA